MDFYHRFRRGEAESVFLCILKHSYPLRQAQDIDMETCATTGSMSWSKVDDIQHVCKPSSC